MTGLFLGRRGKTPGHERDVAKTIQYKAQSIRNKCGKGLYKAKMKVSRADADHPNFKKLMELGLAAAGCVEIVDDAPAMMVSSIETGQLTVSEDFVKLAQEKLEEAEKVRDEDFRRSQAAYAPLPSPTPSPPPSRPPSPLPPPWPPPRLPRPPSPHIPIPPDRRRMSRR